MPDYLDVPVAILRRVRVACAHLPEAHEEQAFTGTRWRIRGHTLVHVLTRDYGQGPVTSMTVHAAGEELDALVAMGDHFYPGWGGGLVAMVLRDDGTTDWEEVKELVTESYCLLAPKKLIRLLGPTRPDA
ncbi:MAG: MmcQ/YjbR family DNA-binding protein [Acidimicrobiales bacterium]